MKRYAFTLAELMVSVLVISIIMVVLAPVITRRMKDTLTVQTDNIKGLEIYTNPGTYSFDVPIGINTLFIQGSGGGGGGGGTSTSSEIKVTNLTNTTWTVPKGVNQIKLRIVGAGGGGGSGCGNPTNKVCKSYDWDRWNSGLSVSKVPEYAIVRGADDGGDLCIFTHGVHGGYPNAAAIKDFTVGDGNNCTTDYCCWRTGNDPKKGIGVCTYKAADQLCQYYPSPNSLATSGSTNPERTTYRLPSAKELRYIANNVANLYTLINICGNNSVTYCPGQIATYPADRTCIEGYSGDALLGTSGGHRYDMWGSNNSIYRTYTFTCQNYVLENTVTTTSKVVAQAKCVRPLKHYTQYGGAGGSSGATLERNINVLPGDTLTITVGSGGVAGKYGTTIDNGRGTRSGNGGRGSDTKVVHKRSGIELGTYYVKGGLGGWAAASDRTGAALTNEQANPSDMCYVKSRKNTNDTFSGGNISCTLPSYVGGSGTGLTGGDGGKLNNTGAITQGGGSSGGYIYDDPNRTFGTRNTTKEADYAKGQNASEYGFGGGGGLTPTWANSTSHFFQGGKGGQGKVEIIYKIAIPGSGGGAGSRVGGVNATSNTDYEIKYKVKEGDRIVFEVGSGGSGGSQGQNGLNGTPTIVGDNKIVFLAGEGGKALTQEQKDNLSQCVQNTANQTAVTNCINNSTYKPQGGQTGIINKKGELQATTSGLIIGDTKNISYTVSNSSFKGQNGNAPAQLNISTVPWSYGFDGGKGGAPFGIRAANAAAAVTCGGGITGVYGALTDVLNYVCTSGNINGNSGRSHDAANNEFGGSGGGGGGLINDSFDLGMGGNGSSGYLRIRWDVTEQE